jgi:hypothetical protein
MASKKASFDWMAATANDLRGGEAVFRRPDGTWTRDVTQAELAHGPEAGKDLLARAQADHEACIVVEPVLIEIDPATRLPRQLRERIRADGPTIEAA